MLQKFGKDSLDHAKKITGNINEKSIYCVYSMLFS